MLVFAFAGLPVDPVIIIVSLIVIVAIVVGVVFLMRSGNKKKGMAATGSNGDWQRQMQPGAWNQQGPWGQQGQGQWGAPNPATQAGNWAGGPQNQNPWGAPAQQQQPANPWGAPAQQQQPANPWGAPAQQQQPANPWGAPAEQQQQSANPWGAPAQQQQSANPWGTPAQQQQSANPWEPAPASTSQDPWGQQQAAASQQQAWGMQAAASAPVQQSQQAPTAFGTSSPPAGGWAQTQQAAPWGNQGAAPPAAQPATSGGLSGWQQGNMGSSGAFEADKTVLRSAGQQSGVVGYVQVKEGKEPGRVYEIRKESLSIGRSRESDIFLEDLAVSRLHASIVNMGNGTYSLKDEGSANGTKVNDQLVDKFKTYQLQEGDQIQLGQTVLVFAKH
jgi:FHA domain-containing protein